MLELNSIYNLDCREGLKMLDSNSVDLTVTSPPYDSLRTYQDDEFTWNFDIFKEVADELYRVTRPGGVVVWVVGDEVVNGGETGTSFRQALYFQEVGFKIHDTMIYEKNSSTFPARINSKRYSQIFEYMFVFVKGKIRDDIKLIADKRNKWAGWTNWGTKTQYDKEGNLVAKTKNIKPTPEFSLRTNIWKYTVSFNDKTGHPAVFPEKLAEDHILSWTNEGDTVLDPFMGSGTTAKMAMLNKRNYIGFEKNKDYWEVSLKRVGKYNGQFNENLEIAEINDTKGGSDEYQIKEMDDKEFNEKNEFCQSLVDQLKDYAETMSIGILKTLKLTFVTKANDRRVEQVLRERGEYSGTTESRQEYIKPESTVVSEVDLANILPKANTPDIRSISYSEECVEDLKSQITDTERRNNFLSAYIHHPDKFIRTVSAVTTEGVITKEEKFTPEYSDELTVAADKLPPVEKEFVPSKENIEKIVEESISKSFSEGIIGKAIAELSKKIDKFIEAPKVALEEEVVGCNDNCIDLSHSFGLDFKGNEPIQTNFEPIQEKKKRGRPRGSKNKPKQMLENAAPIIVSTVDSDNE